VEKTFSLKIEQVFKVLLNLEVALTSRSWNHFVVYNSL